MGGGGAVLEGKLSPNAPPAGWEAKMDRIVLTQGDRPHLPLTRSVLQRPPLHSHFRHGSDKRAIPVTFTNEIYDFIGDLLDRVSIIPYVFGRLEKGERSDTGPGQHFTVAVPESY